jgi:hypothetical protein
MALPTRAQQRGLLILAVLLVVYWLVRHLLRF